MATPAAGVDFDRNRLNTGELIAGIAGLVLLIDLWFKWYGVKVSGGGGLLKGFSIGVSASAWQVFSFIDILLFLIALLAIGVAVMRAMDRMPEMPYPPATLIAGAGGLALLLILYRTIDTPIDTHGVNGIDVTRKFGLWLGLIAAAAITDGGWGAVQGEGGSFGGAGSGAGGAGGVLGRSRRGGGWRGCSCGVAGAAHADGDDRSGRSGRRRRRRVAGQGGPRRSASRHEHRGSGRGGRCAAPGRHDGRPDSG